MPIGGIVGGFIGEMLGAAIGQIAVGQIGRESMDLSQRGCIAPLTQLTNATGICWRSHEQDQKAGKQKCGRIVSRSQISMDQVERTVPSPVFMPLIAGFVVMRPDTTGARAAATTQEQPLPIRG